VTSGVAWLALALLAVAGCGDDDAAGPTTSTTSAATATTEVGASVDDAIASWVAARRAEVFPGFAGAYVGPCREGVLDVVCSIDREDLGVRRIVGVGVAASDWGADVLLERGTAGWRAVEHWTWDLEGGEPGPPFSPLTALAEWWATTDPGVTFIRDCAEVDPSITGQRFVCAELVEAQDEVRTYVTGPPQDVHELEVVLRHNQDHTWTVD
jgi:hypothetical protein